MEQFLECYDRVRTQCVIYANESYHYVDLQWKCVYIILSAYCAAIKKRTLFISSFQLYYDLNKIAKMPTKNLLISL